MPTRLGLCGRWVVPFSVSPDVSHTSCSVAANTEITLGAEKGALQVVLHNFYLNAVQVNTQKQ